MVMGRNGYGPKWSWAEMVMGRNDPESSFLFLMILYEWCFSSLSRMQMSRFFGIKLEAEAIRTTVVPIRILIRTTVVPIRILIGTTVVRIRILIGTTRI